MGVAILLYEEIENEAVKRGSSILHSTVSITANPFFGSRDFKSKENRPLS
jgi:hypothetical protein